MNIDSSEDTEFEVEMDASSNEEELEKQLKKCEACKGEFKYEKRDIELFLVKYFGVFLWQQTFYCSSMHRLLPRLLS